MTTRAQFMSAAIAAGLAIAPLHTIDRTLPHAAGEATALAAVGNDGLVYGGFNPHWTHDGVEPWFLAGDGLDLSRPADADRLYASLC